MANNIYLENWANKLRDEMGFRIIEPVSIHQILKDKHIIAYFYPMGEGLSGMAIKVHDAKNEKLFMLVNTSDPYCKQRFTAAHELYHLLIQEKFSYSYDEDVWRDKDKEEVNANYFATYFLLPEAGIRQLIPIKEQKKDKISIATLLKLEHNFRCSRQTLLYRLRHLGLVSEDYISKHSGGVIKQAIEYGYDISLYIKTERTELIGDYNILARELYDKGMISQAKYYSYLRDMNLNLKEAKNAEKSNLG
ncbi:MAG: ImmA/IrrE family metallo-endopeptidase [Prevotella sp.]